jgi:hypothetical protein
MIEAALATCLLIALLVIHQLVNGRYSDRQPAGASAPAGAIDEKGPRLRAFRARPKPR